MGTSDPALLRARDALAGLDTTAATTADVLVALTSVIVDLTEAVAALTPATDPEATP